MATSKMAKGLLGLGSILLLWMSSTALAQIETSIQYLPLELGNSWSYIDILRPPPDFQADTLWSVRTIVEPIAYNDTLYYSAGFGGWGASAVREDDTGNIWAFVESEQYSALLFDFYLEDGAMIEFPETHPFFPGYVLTVSTFGAIEPSGRPRWISFDYTLPNAVDASWHFSFEAELGVTSFGGGIGEFWRLHAATIHGNVINIAVEGENPIPEHAYFENNFPNPFSVSTTINFKIPRPSHVRLIAYDVLGREIEILVDEPMSPGSYSTDFYGAQLAPGLYFIHLTSDDSQAVQKILLAR